MDDYEIVRLKNTFTDGVEYLRNFQVRSLINKDVFFFFFFFFKLVFSPTPTSFSIEKSGFRLARMQGNCPKPSPPVESCAFLYPNFREGRPNHDRSIFHITSSRSGIYRLSSHIWPDHSDFLWRAITSAFQTARPTTEWIRILQDTGNQS